MAGSGFIKESRGATPKPSSKMNIPAKKNAPPASLRFTQAELSRREADSKVVTRPSRGGPGN